MTTIANYRDLMLTERYTRTCKNTPGRVPKCVTRADYEANLNKVIGFASQLLFSDQGTVERER